MKRKLFSRTIGCCVAVSMLAGTALAQEAVGGSSVPSSTGLSPQPPAPASTALISPKEGKRHCERLSQLMGSTVKDKDGNTLGLINDFVINPTTGHIQYAVISLNDRTTKLTAVPWQLVRRGSDPASCMLNVSKDKLTSAQTFEASSWPDFSQAATEQQIYAHYGVQSEYMGGVGSQSGSDKGSGSSGSDLNKSDGNSGTHNNNPKNR